jgi:glyoxylase-like metal-dependent hydrolase (beta-lactamase superfamily II)
MTTQAAEFQMLSDTLCHWSVYEPSVKCEIGCTAIRVGSGWVVIDPVPLSQASWDELLADAPLRAILLTNGNHTRDTLALRKRHQVPVVTAPDTRRDIEELRPDVTLLPNELLYGLVAIAIPGATKGETAFFSKAAGVMVLGDAVINVSTEKGLEFLPKKYCTDAKQNRESLRKLLDFDFHTLTMAHGPPVVDRAKARLAALLNSTS